MKTHDVQSISISASADAVFGYVANPANLPLWTSAFAIADASNALMRTPSGEVSVKLQTTARRDSGTIDWMVTFPDGVVGAAYSRVTPDGAAKSVYSFVLMAPPVPLEALEGALETQMHTLAEELLRLRKLLETA